MHVGYRPQPMCMMSPERVHPPAGSAGGFGGRGLGERQHIPAPCGGGDVGGRGRLRGPGRLLGAAHTLDALGAPRLAAALAAAAPRARAAVAGARARVAARLVGGVGAVAGVAAAGAAAAVGGGPRLSGIPVVRRRRPGAGLPAAMCAAQGRPSPRRRCCYGAAVVLVGRALAAWRAGPADRSASWLGVGESRVSVCARERGPAGGSALGRSLAGLSVGSLVRRTQTPSWWEAQSQPPRSRPRFPPHCTFALTARPSSP